MGLDQAEVQTCRALCDAVAAGVSGFEREALRTQLFHVQPDGNTAHAELSGEGVARKKFRLRSQQLAEDHEFSRRHAKSGAGGRN